MRRARLKFSLLENPARLDRVASSYSHLASARCCELKFSKGNRFNGFQNKSDGPFDQSRLNKTKRRNPNTTMMLTRLSFMIFLIVICFATASAQSITSVYTNLTGKQCKTLKQSNDEGGSYEGQCPGVAGYKLLVQEGDLRQNIVVITPAGKKKSLELWSVVGSGFSSLGNKAEWRLKGPGAKASPIALIIRYNVANPEDSTKSTSWLAVVRIGSDPAQICVTETIAPGADQNVKAREAADNSASKPCKTNSN